MIWVVTKGLNTVFLSLLNVDFLRASCIAYHIYHIEGCTREHASDFIVLLCVGTWEQVLPFLFFVQGKVPVTDGDARAPLTIDYLISVAVCMRREVNMGIFSKVYCLCEIFIRDQQKFSSRC